MEFDVFSKNRLSKLGSIFDAILVPTWLHFGEILDVLGGSGRLLGPLGGVLGPSWGVLAASWRVLDLKSRLGGLSAASWRRLGLQNPPNINLTRHGTGSADFFLDASCSLRFPKQVSWNVFGSQSLPQAPGRSARLARCARSLAALASPW